MFLDNAKEQDDELVLDLANFKCHSLYCTTTLEEMIDVAKMTKLRFYMTTKRDLRTSKSVTSSDSESLLEAFLPEPIAPQDTAEKSTEF